MKKRAGNGGGLLLTLAAIAMGTAGCTEQGEDGGRDDGSASAPGQAQAEASQSASEAVASMTADELLASLEGPEGPIALDVRSPEEYLAGHIDGAINVPFDQIEANLDILNEYRERGLVVYCRTGHRAGIAETTLRESGFERVWDLEGHMVSWNARELPLVVPVAD
jgi:rhodanese-related sulfurtransferase